MKKKLPNILFIYCLVASIFITASLFLTSTTGSLVMFTTLFLPVTGYFVVEGFAKLKNANEPENARPTEYILIVFIFFILVSIGIFNIYFKKQIVKTESSKPLIVTKNEPTPTSTPIETVTIKISDGSAEINIRSKPTIYSDKISSAKDGDVFELIQKSGEWYEVKIDETITGFISFKYIKQ